MDLSRLTLTASLLLLCIVEKTKSPSRERETRLFLPPCCRVTILKVAKEAILGGHWKFVNTLRLPKSRLSLSSLAAVMETTLESERQQAKFFVCRWWSKHAILLLLAINILHESAVTLSSSSSSSFSGNCCVFIRSSLLRSHLLISHF